MRFSQKTNGFYPESIDYKELPDDFIFVSDELYQAVLAKNHDDTLDVKNGELIIIPAPPLSLSDLLAQAKSLKIVELNASCEAAIMGGHQSLALGLTHTYPSSLIDQTNLSANVVQSLLPGLPSDWITIQKCTDAQSITEFVPHTALQIQQAGRDVIEAIKALLLKNAKLKSEVKNAVDLETINGIAWENNTK